MVRRMKLALLSSLGSPWSYELIENIALAGVDVHLFQLAPEAGQAYIDPSSPEWIARLDRIDEVVKTREVLEPGSGILRYPKLGRILKSRLKGFDHLLTLYGGGLALAAKCSGFKNYSVYAVGSDILQQEGLAVKASKMCLESARAVFCNGDQLMKSTRELAPKANLFQLLIGVNVDRFVPAEAPAKHRLICTRGFLPIYNNLDILRALPLLPSDLPDWEIVFAAGGELLPQAESIVSGFSGEVASRIKFLRGISGDRVVRELQQSTIFVSMSRSDGTATSLLEALSCGLLPILSDIPANRSWANPGALVPLDDVGQLASALEMAIRRPISDDIRAQARQQVMSRANAKSNAKELVNLLSSL